MVVKLCPYGGKRIYRTRKKAIKASHRFKAFFLQHGGNIATHYYKCPNCGYWHLTKREQTNKE